MLKKRKWKKVKLDINEYKVGKKKQMDGWENEEGYLVCLNINKGTEAKVGKKDTEGHRWWMEITKENKYIGEAPTLPEAKKLAEKIKKEAKKKAKESPAQEEPTVLVEKKKRPGRPLGSRTKRKEREI